MSLRAIQSIRAAPSEGIRWVLTGTLGRVRERTQRGKRLFYVDFRPFGRIWTIPNPTGAKPITIPDWNTAQRILESVRGAVGEGKTLEQALSQWLPKIAAEARFRSRYALWIERMEARVDVGEISESYVAELRRYGRRGGYLDSLAEVPVHALSYGHFEDLTAGLARRGLSPKTRAHVLAALRAFLRWLRRRGDIRDVPEIPSLPLPEHQPRLLEPAVQRAVLDAIPEGRRGIFLALAHHGLRPSEASRLDVSDYDWKTGTITISARKAKVKRSAVIPCSDELRGWIEAHVTTAARLAGGALFQNERGRTVERRWSLDALEDAWTLAAASVGAEASLYEGTKHSSATAALRRGTSLEEIRRALRHADVRSTERYARASDLAPVEVLVARVSLLPLARPRQEKKPSNGD